MKYVKRGFTFIELILYLGLSSLILGALVTFAWDVIYGRVKAQVQLEVNQNIRYVSSRIESEIRGSSGVVEMSATSLILSNSNPNYNPTVIELVGDEILIGQGSVGDCPSTNPCPITSDRVSVGELIFTDMSSLEMGNIKYVMKIDYLNPDNIQRYKKSESITNAVSIR
ncbi:MAG: hypothetical protein DRN14_06100 [Thermoplasmata archaeon]|nr:MAG: hypothetical protein DRN14_06100 [Thermoplasmata archaeon]